MHLRSTAHIVRYASAEELVRGKNISMSASSNTAGLGNPRTSLGALVRGEIADHVEE